MIVLTLTLQRIINETIMFIVNAFTNVTVNLS